MTTEEKHSDALALMMMAALLIVLWVGVYLVFDENGYITPEYVAVEDVLVSKQSEQESLNNFGAFKTNYYFLYESGELEKVKLEDYMYFKEGDTITNYKIKDE